MQVCYCDLCGLPIHGKHIYLAVIHDDNPQNQNPYRQPQARETYEVDESCYKLLIKIFDLKKSKIAEVKKFLDETYKLPSNRKGKGKSKKKSGIKIQFKLERREN